jgi:HK97 family phage portal protein
MIWMDRLSALLARKSSRAGAAVAAIGLPAARWTPRRYEALAEEGYRRNVIAYRCVREVARACASVPWLLYKDARELDQHPLLDLLLRPNPRQSGPELIEAAIGHLLLSGNAYLEVVRPDDGIPRELYALRPDRMRVVPDVSGVPRAYRYEVEGRSVDWPVDPITGASDVLHLRDFHPLDDWYGLSPIEAAAAAIDQHNAAAEHNAALLQNGARPSGALVFRSDPGPDGIRRVEEALLDRTQGPRQAGRPLVLGGDVDWKELGFAPKDMDFAEMKAQAAREISSAFGVPHLLVVAGEATYSNRADARLELWEHTVIPLLDRLSSALTSWLGPMFGPDLRLAHDLDEVPRPQPPATAQMAADPGRRLSHPQREAPGARIRPNRQLCRSDQELRELRTYPRTAPATPTCWRAGRRKVERRSV